MYKYLEVARLKCLNKMDMELKFYKNLRECKGIMFKTIKDGFAKYYNDGIIKKVDYLKYIHLLKNPYLVKGD